ncbi:MAG: hypothetical protein R3E98_19050 [Gemmatimonadota bacterium]|nr:hypothetical protein [Gemmatimonadota bacterium]
MIFWIVAGGLALGVGIWLGLPGDSTVSKEEADEALSNPYRIRKRTKKVFTPLDWLRANKRSQLRDDDLERFRTVRSKKDRDRKDHDPNDSTTKDA